MQLILSNDEMLYIKLRIIKNQFWIDYVYYKSNSNLVILIYQSSQPSFHVTNSPIVIFMHTKLRRKLMHDRNMPSIGDFQFLTSLSLSLNTNEHETFFSRNNECFCENVLYLDLNLLSMHHEQLVLHKGIKSIFVKCRLLRKAKYFFTMYVAFRDTSTLNMFKFILKCLCIQSFFISNYCLSKIGNCDVTTETKIMIIGLTT